MMSQALVRSDALVEVVNGHEALSSTKSDLRMLETASHCGYTRQFDSNTSPDDKALQSAIENLLRAGQDPVGIPTAHHRAERVCTIVLMHYTAPSVFEVRQRAH